VWVLRVPRVSTQSSPCGYAEYRVWVRRVARASTQRMAKSKCEAADEIAQFSDELADDRELLFLVFETCNGRLYSNQAHAKTRWRLPSRLRRARREAKRHRTESVCGHTLSYQEVPVIQSLSVGTLLVTRKSRGLASMFAPMGPRSGRTKCPEYSCRGRRGPAA
jgi:hypothetical protein